MHPDTKNLELALSAARTVSSLPAIARASDKQRETLGVIQNLEAAIRALERGSDDQGRAITPPMIGDGLARMLQYMTQHAIWFRLHADVDDQTERDLDGLQDKIQGAADALRTTGAVSDAQERYVDNGDGTITDTQTGLMWQTEDDGSRRSLTEARTYCETLIISGYDGWRLPTIEEMLLVGSNWKQLFVNVKDDEPYWSNTVPPRPPHIPKDAAKVMFADGEVNQYFTTNRYYTRAVRYASPA